MSTEEDGKAMKCRLCGDDHDLHDMDPVFWRPDAFVMIPEAERTPDRAAATEDYCEILEEDRKRHFIRALVPVEVEGRSPLFWGIWVEVDEIMLPDIRAWSKDGPGAPDEVRVPCKIANEVPGYMPTTVGLHGKLLFGADRKFRPMVELALHHESGRPIEHKWVSECHGGVTRERAAAWVHGVVGIGLASTVPAEKRGRA